MNQEHQLAIRRLNDVTGELRKVINNIPTSMVSSRPSADEWSVTETLVHVRNVAMLAYGLRIRRLVYEDDPLFANYDEDSKNLEAMKKSQKVDEAMGMIVGEHKAISQLLTLLPDEAWDRSGRHPESGRLTIAFFAARLAEHAEEHLNQIKEIKQALV